VALLARSSPGCAPACTAVPPIAGVCSGMHGGAGDWRGLVGGGGGAGEGDRSFQCVS
jgi:hypothetical protein